MKVYDSIVVRVMVFIVMCTFLVRVHSEETPVGASPPEEEVQANGPDGTDLVQVARSYSEGTKGGDLDFNPSDVLTLEVEARKMDCVHERFQINLDMASTEVQGAFFVDGDKDQILAVKVSNENSVMYASNGAVKEGTFSFTLAKSGVYDFCFDNGKSGSDKRVVFAIDIKTGSSGVAEMLKTEHLEQSKSILRRMIRLADNIFQDVKFMGLRLINQASLQDAMNRQVILWSVVESLVVLGVAYAQAHFIRRLVERRNQKVSV